MAKHLVGEQILDIHEIEPAFCSWHARDVRAPCLGWSCRDKRLGHDSLCYGRAYWESVVVMNCRTRWQRGPSFLCRDLMRPTPAGRRSVMPLGDALGQTCVGCARVPPKSPRPVAHSLGCGPTDAGASRHSTLLGHLKGLIQEGREILGAQRRHESVPVSGAFAKCAVVFLRMSRSIRASASSDFSRKPSVSSSVTGRRGPPEVANGPLLD